jgi:hypothetical protein
MTRRRYIQIDGELVEVMPDYAAPARTITDSVLWNDRAYQDMGDPRFSSRTQHQQYMKRHGVTVSDDFKGQWAKQEAQRIAARAGADPTRRQDVERAISQLNSRRRK